VIAPDHIGCGLSEAPRAEEYGFTFRDRVADFTALMDTLALDRITLVLHDWGGAVGVAFALQRTERIRRIVVTNTAAFFPPQGKHLPLRLAFVRNVAWLSAPLVLGLNLFSAAAVYMAAKRRLPPDVKRGLTAPYSTPRRRLSTYRFVRDIPVRATDESYPPIKQMDDNLHRLNRPDLPFLILWGMRDFVFDADYFNEWKRRFPRAEAIAYPKAGHYLFEDAPVETIDAIRGFLRRHP
jgi:haloalkane dehalogenase